MEINKKILQMLIKGYSGYFIGNRQTSYFNSGETKYKNEAIFFSPSIPNELQGCENIGEKSFDLVEDFAESEFHLNIFLGKRRSPPFQLGLRYEQLVSIEPVTCSPMELIVACYEEDISEYYEVLKKMKELSEKKV